MNTNKLEQMLPNKALLQSGWAGIVSYPKTVTGTYERMQSTVYLVVDRRESIYAKPIKENKFLGIPTPNLVKKLYRGKVVGILEVDNKNTKYPTVLVRSKDGQRLWVPLDQLKTYNYKSKKAKTH